MNPTQATLNILRLDLPHHLVEQHEANSDSANDGGDGYHKTHPTLGKAALT